MNHRHGAEVDKTGGDRRLLGGDENSCSIMSLLSNDREERLGKGFGSWGVGDVLQQLVISEGHWERER